eukprot:TRINITY_DN3415_c0_g1_i1.p1 TRINITY_DN3415_c0_g1~~TRINITY_DN3415_c0_g1_i1.p1  ORF type:complete len:762 (-),score=154.04 TRINITY_DN3415_c0_g1_i1:275-2560(-)
MLRFLCALLLPGLLAWGQEAVCPEDSLSMLQRAAASARRAKNPLPPQFFESFDQAESTYSESFIDRTPQSVLDWGGFTTGQMQGTPENAFENTPSAGKHQAWQTYPRLPTDGTWTYQGRGMQEMATLSHLHRDGGIKPAGWYDTSVLNYNKRGQPIEPQLDSPERLQAAMPGQEWTQRATNTTLKCKAVGCTAVSLLNVFDPDTEEATSCKLKIDLHPTDYDNEWSREFVKTFKVNGAVASANCYPKARGCNATAWRPLVPCVQDLSVDHLLKEEGSLTIEGTINRMVDECPYQGDLLSGVATVTCMARKKVQTLPHLSPVVGIGGVGGAGFLHLGNGEGGGQGIASIESAEAAAQKACVEAADRARRAGASPEEVKETCKKAAEEAFQAKQSAAVQACKAAAERARSAGKSIQQASQACAQAVLHLAKAAHLSEDQAANLAAAMAKAEAGVLAKKAGMSPAEVSQEMQKASDTVLENSMPGVKSEITGRFNCSKPGCRASTMLKIDPAIARSGATCKMDVHVIQTDFDESVGVPEVIEFISLEGAGNLTTNVKPGRNPCTEEFSSGKSVPLQERVFPVITGWDVTKDILKPPIGQLILSGKISLHVDECGSNGALLDGYVRIRCSMPKHTAAKNVAGNSPSSNQSKQTAAEDIQSKQTAVEDMTVDATASNHFKQTVAEDNQSKQGTAKDMTVDAMTNQSKQTAAEDIQSEQTEAENMTVDTMTHIAAQMPIDAPDRDGLGSHAIGPVELIMAAIEAPTD